MASTTVRPPVLDDVAPAPRVVDYARFLWWNERGFLHGARHGRGGGRLLSIVLAVLWWPTLPLTVPIQIVLAARPWARYYMTPQRDAVLVIAASRHGWHVQDHASARPGTGRGRALRAAVIPKLLAAADAEQVPVMASAATAGLAAAYMAEVSGLVDVGRGHPRGRRLRRPPAPANDSPHREERHHGYE